MTSVPASRVSDAVKTAALLAVVAGHSLAWTSDPHGAVSSTLDAVPDMWWVTWLLQVLPLFFVLSSTGMRRLAQATDGQQLAVRVALLVAPVLPLYLVGILIAGITQTVSPSNARVAGVLTIQLTWFIGMYVLILAAAPLIVRCTNRGLVIWFLAVAVIDAIRVHVAAPIGWLNMFAVWSAFMLLGLRLEAIRALGHAWQITGLVASLVVSVLLIEFGPYSRALISTEALPGLSNLAPPSAVLLSFGTAQTFALVLAWPALSRWIARPRIDQFFSAISTRAMQVYLYHLIIVGIIAGLLVALGIRPMTLSPLWWLVHLFVFTIAVSVTYFSSSVMRILTGAILLGLQRLAPAGRTPHKNVTTAASFTTGLLMLHLAGRGVANLLTATGGTGLGIPPALSLIAVVVLCGYLSTRGNHTLTSN